VGSVEGVCAAKLRQAGSRHTCRRGPVDVQTHSVEGQTRASGGCGAGAPCGGCLGGCRGRLSGAVVGRLPDRLPRQLRAARGGVARRAGCGAVGVRTLTSGYYMQAYKVLTAWVQACTGTAARASPTASGTLDQLKRSFDQLKRSFQVTTEVTV
jgi:hypothetical protein